jgi:hypothetical protein
VTILSANIYHAILIDCDGHLNVGGHGLYPVRSHAPVSFRPNKRALACKNRRVCVRVPHTSTPSWPWRSRRKLARHGRRKNE